MATVADSGVGKNKMHFSGSLIASAIDRWIYVYMAASFVVITLTGFIPDSIVKIAAVNAGERPPFPLALHFHAVLMGSFLLLVLAQTSMAATGRLDLHRRLGPVAMLLVPALVIVGLILVPTIYHQVWNAAQNAPPETKVKLQQAVLVRDNIMLLQLRVGLLFPLFIFIGLWARTFDAGLHKRMMILATILPLGAAFFRIGWLPTTIPASPLSSDIYLLLTSAPMFAWDLVRNRKVHRAYLIWLGVSLVASLPLYAAWGSSWWHALAPRLMGV